MEMMVVEVVLQDGILQRLNSVRVERCWRKEAYFRRVAGASQLYMMWSWANMDGTRRWK